MAHSGRAHEDALGAPCAIAASSSSTPPGDRPCEYLPRGRKHEIWKVSLSGRWVKIATISENRMLDVLYRMGLRGKATVHGFRGLASTVLNESGLFEPDWIEHQIAHTPRGVRAAYNSARYLNHRRRMMCWWADYLDAAETRSEAATIVHRIYASRKRLDFRHS